TGRVDRAFETHARAFLADHAWVRHEWREIASHVWGNRTDLICDAGTPREIWATLRADSIAVGAGDDHQDFEDFGRGLSDEELAEAAFRYFCELLESNGYLHEAI